MHEEIFQVETPDGTMETFTVRPSSGVHPAIVLYMDAPGIREELYGFCRRIAGEGYFVVLPDMYYRLGRKRFGERVMSDEVRQEVFACMRSLSNELVVRDTGALLRFLETAEGAGQGPKGCIGYCMSGQYVVSVAGYYPHDIAAAASLYGVGIVTGEPDSPHLLANRINGELYLGFASDDPYVPDNVIPDLRAALDANQVTYTLDIWPGTEHGFCFPARPVYVEDAAEQVWRKVFEMYGRCLPGGG